VLKLWTSETKVSVPENIAGMLFESYLIFLCKETYFKFVNIFEFENFLKIIIRSSIIPAMSNKYGTDAIILLHQNLMQFSFTRTTLACDAYKNGHLYIPI